MIAALLFFGPLSDAKGRRELLIPAIAVAALAAGLFAAAHSVAMLFVAQAVQAMALGALQGTAAPTLVEQDPSGQRRRASATASALTVAGAAAGPLLAGLLVQYAVLPQRLAYLVEIALLAVALVSVLAVVPRRRDRRSWRPRRPAVPGEIHRPFVILVVVASNGGSERHPGWYHNLEADPVVSVQIGRRRCRRPLVPPTAERQELWKLANKNNRGLAPLLHWGATGRYDGYQTHTTRTIPVVVLTPDD